MFTRAFESVHPIEQDMPGGGRYYGPGLSVLEYYAAAALTGLIAAGHVPDARVAFEYAAAMVEESAKYAKKGG